MFDGLAPWLSTVCFCYIHCILIITGKTHTKEPHFIEHRFSRVNIYFWCKKWISPQKNFANLFHWPCHLAKTCTVLQQFGFSSLAVYLTQPIRDHVARIMISQYHLANHIWLCNDMKQHCYELEKCLILSLWLPELTKWECIAQEYIIFHELHSPETKDFNIQYYPKLA